MIPIALQTYTLRDDMEHDFDGTLRYIADIGYRGIEVGGLYQKQPSELAQAAKDLGLSITSNHGALPTAESLNEALDLQTALGSTRLVNGFGPDDVKTVDGCKSAAGKLQAAADLLKPHGITVHVHNHFWEFQPVADGRYPLDVMLAEAPGIFSELDLYWVAYAGADPAEVIARYPSRMELVHVKDGMVGGGYRFKALGTGQVDLPAAIQALDPAVTQWLVVEQDASDGDMRQDVKTSHDYLISHGLASGSKQDAAGPRWPH